MSIMLVGSSLYFFGKWQDGLGTAIQGVRESQIDQGILTTEARRVRGRGLIWKKKKREGLN